MKITIQHFEGCPNLVTAEQRVAEAVGERADVEVVHQLVNSIEEAEAVGFPGSPTVLADGVDVVPNDGPPAFACRRYSGGEGAPTVDQIRRALA